MCEKCGKYYTSPADLRRHIHTHSGERPYICDLCPKVFKCTSGLRKHKLHGHAGIKPYQCTMCGMKHASKWDLNRHVISHSDELNHECKFCSKKFKTKYSLRLHLRQHTGERPYACLECNMHFVRGTNYKVHLKRRHRLLNISITNRHQYPFPPEDNS
ncbi:zinc finger protein 177-like [Chrysoperla carnea]|uniref:zinc finger protein 177-like n=1 Tax=Chrysoperla carnea TaxID=189513 RepID=UPI001D081173|nr:zinc finger protein 177-like [Chrysoperla carnea]